jgi:hypothetical protein
LRVAEFGCGSRSAIPRIAAGSRSGKRRDDTRGAVNFANNTVTRISDIEISCAIDSSGNLFFADGTFNVAGGSQGAGRNSDPYKVAKHFEQRQE